MNGILTPLNELNSYKEIIDSVRKKETPVLATGVIETQKCHLIYGILERLKKNGIIITHSELQAKEIVSDLKYFLGERVMHYPSKDVIFYNADVKSVQITRSRFKVIEKLLKEEDVTIVMSMEAVLDRLTPREEFKKFVIEVKIGDELSIRELSEKLVLMGYEKAEMVEGIGQFAVRGGIMDIFSALNDNAVRIEFWGDEVDSIRLLDKYSQRSIENMETTEIFPMREVVYEKERIKEVIGKLGKDLTKTVKQYEKKGLQEEAERISEIIKWDMDKLGTGYTTNGIDRYINYIYEDNEMILDYIKGEYMVFVDEPRRANAHVDNIIGEFGESVKNRIEKAQILPKQMEIIFSQYEIWRNIEKMETVLLSTLPSTINGVKIKGISTFDVKSAVTLSMGMESFIAELRQYVDKGYRVVVMGESATKSSRIATEINYSIPTSYYDNMEGVEAQKGRIYVTQGNYLRGFVYEQIKFAVITIDSQYSKEKSRSKSKGWKIKGSKIENALDLQIGDYIVHENHGIGIFKGIEQMEVEGTIKDYLKLQYSDNGILYVHSSQMDLVQKYIGTEGSGIKTHKLGGSDWSKSKTRTKKAVADLAKELLELYAKREMSKGFRFSLDNVWQTEFEDTFPYEETEDQLRCIEDVKKDMEQERTMDRLVCGDVGYGKTEIAIRAAFKSVQDGKQVAYLVPTTILAQQHYNTFAQRMKNYPINVDMMSRFKSTYQLKKTIGMLEKGEVDIVIGTHRLLSKDIKFKDLGLIIVDEEQRFGVTHKEKLKRLKENVDVLTLTATPIPRTLHMSMIGIRDMSVLEQPPQERQPVQTYVMEHNFELVKDAINRELTRGGQVYYLSNRVNNISDIAYKVQSLAPNARVSYAHGQMSERELEEIMMNFIEGGIDILVCTTIIETGLDIPNANTIIIQDADRMGLAQLYQLRGRVGRANRLAYAYLMYKKDKMLKETTEKRLQTIKDFTEFGSGFKIAMRDLEIRGAGSLLGSQQHGHVGAIGYEMYCKLLNDAIKEQRGGKVAEEFETNIDININAHIPSKYISNEQQKLEIYKKISLIKTIEDYMDCQDEIEDRFGTAPKQVQNLLDIAILKAVAHDKHIVNVKHMNSTIVMKFRKDAEVDINKVLELVKDNKMRLMLKSDKGEQELPPLLVYKIARDENAPKLKELKDMLQKI